jgi:hypothetical protein
VDEVGTLPVVGKSGNNLPNVLGDERGQNVVSGSVEVIDFAAGWVRVSFFGNCSKNRDMYTVFHGYR